MKIDGTIRPDELTEGMKLLYKGTGKQAKRIAMSQAIRFPELIAKGWHELNHVGDILEDKDLGVLIYEQDGMGKFGTSTLDEYRKMDGEIYIVKYNRVFHRDRLRAYRMSMKRYAAEDTVLNYSYKSLLNYLYNAIVYSITGRDKWIWRAEPKGTTCSQIAAKFALKLGIRLPRKSWLIYPCEFAYIGGCKIYKLVL